MKPHGRAMTGHRRERERRGDPQPLHVALEADAVDLGDPALVDRKRGDARGRAGQDRVLAQERGHGVDDPAAVALGFAEPDGREREAELDVPDDLRLQPVAIGLVEQPQVGDEPGRAEGLEGLGRCPEVGVGLGDLDAGRGQALDRGPADRAHLGLERCDPEVVAPGDPGRELGAEGGREERLTAGLGARAGPPDAARPSRRASARRPRRRAPSGPRPRACRTAARPARAQPAPATACRPTTEQNDAGVRRLPPRSEPVASQTCPVASATAEPPEEPPHVRLVSHGFRVGPNTSLKVCAPAPNSGVFDLASTTAPRSSSRSTRMSERSGTLSA